MTQDCEINYAYLETTNVCNLHCKYCNRQNVVKQSKHMMLDDWNKVLDKLSSQPINEAKLMGLGEPFFHPHFDEICRRFKAVFPSAFTISATNCQYKLGKNFVAALPFIDLLYLSVDGYMETYERDRDGAKWSNLINFLEDLSNIDTGRTRIAINYVVNNDNFKYIEKINKLISKKYSFIEEVRLNIAQWWSEDEEIQFEINEEFYSTLIKYKQNVKGKTPWTFSDCFWPVRGFYMDVNGDVKICCLNTSTEPIGNIFRSPIHDILNAPKRCQIAEECKKDLPGIHCKKCDYKRLSPILEKIFMQ
ncbi:MAG TPA: radical SAM protein [Candidatus Brocadiaceae bacterium]